MMPRGSGFCELVTTLSVRVDAERGAGAVEVEVLVAVVEAVVVRASRGRRRRMPATRRTLLRRATRLTKIMLRDLMVSRR